MRRSARLAAIAGLGAIGLAPAQGTWSIILIDTRTGEIAVGSATCLTGFDLRANTPVLIPGVGAATAQSFVDSSGQNRVFIRDRLALGVAPQDIVTQLATFDPGHQTRQYGIGDTLGRMATFSGTGAGQWAGGQTGGFAMAAAGQIGSVAYAIQGNVLTGAPVVEQAVRAAISTPGDLPAKLMASMQAARLMGGDGRCSCAPGNPTGCGSPPASFTKSAHIAYMLIARAGDTEGCNGIYRAGSSPVNLLAADLNPPPGDQRPELVVANTSGSNVSVIANLSGSVGPALAPVFAPLPTNYTVGSGPRGLVAADFNGDQLLDLAAAGSSSNTVNLLRGTSVGSFTPAGVFATGASPRAVVAADFDGANGPDLATANFTASNATVLLNDGTGDFSPAPVVPVGAGPIDLAAADLVGSAAIDLAVVSRTANSLSILRGNGDGTFALDQALGTRTGPTALVAADLDGDSDTDLAISCDTVRLIQVFRNDAGVFANATYPLAFAPADLATGDLNGDQRADLFAVTAGSFATLFGTVAGGFVIDRTYAVMGNASAVVLSDLDRDGDLDAALVTGGGAVTVKNRGPGPLLGRFNDGLGCATGDYFMNFNIANAAANDPDPVIQLQGQYDQWRAALVGRPDAVQSSALISPPYLPSIGAPTATMTITLRDWQGLPITAALSSLTVEHAPGSPALAAIGPVQPVGNGVYRVLLTGGATPGTDRFRIRADDGLRPVILMPDPGLSIFAGACYANCDGSTAPPLLNMNDFVCFQQRFAAGDPYADCDAGGTQASFTVADFVCFMQRFAAGCP